MGGGGSSGSDGDSDGGGVCGGGSFVLAVSQDNHHRLPLAGYGVQLTGCLDGCFSSYTYGTKPPLTLGMLGISLTGQLFPFLYTMLLCYVPSASMITLLIYTRYITACKTSQ